MELGAFNPFYRNHTAIGTRDQEPWVHGPEHEAIRRRYQYGRHHVGSAVRMRSGRVFTGLHLETHVGSGVCAEAVAAFGGLDVVVNSAFRGDTFQRVEDADMATWHKIFEVNFFGAMNLSRAAIPHLRARGAGSIVNIASMSARKVREAEAGYAASKAALLTATQSMALELAPDRIRVNAVVPGWIWGPNVQMYVGWQSQSRGITEAEVIAEITENIPLGEVPPQEDIAEAVVFFASGMSRMVTGQSLDVNGGEYFG